MLPRVQDEVTPTRADVVAAPPIRPGATALVVEDQPSILRLISRVLKRAGIQVHEARTAEEGLLALSGFENGVPDLLVTDVVLPGRSGLWLLENVRQRHGKHVPSVFVSGYMGDEGPWPNEDERTAFLAKPFSSKELLAAVAPLLEGTGVGG